MADVLDMPPAPVGEETEEERQQRLARFPSPNLMPPAVIQPPSPRTASGPMSRPTIPPAPIAPETAAPVVNAPMPGPRTSPASAPPVNPRMPPAPTPGGLSVPGYPGGEPQLHGWRKALDTIGSMFPIGQAIETAIPGTPQNYSVRADVANERFNQAAARAAKGQEAQKSEQELEKGAAAAQFDTPEKRRAYAEENPDLFDNMSDFEKNDFILQGKFPQREPPPPKEDKKIDEGYNAKGERVIQYQRPDGTVYNRINPDILKAAPEDANKLAGEIEAQVGPKPTTAEYGGKKYASVSEAQKAWGKEAERVKNEESAAGANARGASFGRNRPVEVIDTWNGNRPVRVSAAEAEDNPERYLTQSGATQALPGTALINDIRTVARNVQQNLGILDEKGFDRAKLAAALANPTTTFQAYLQGLPRGALGDKEQQFVSDLFNLREQAMSIRAIMKGGTGAEDTRSAILNTLPGISSGSKGFGQKQITNLLNLLDRMERGIPAVPLRGGPNDQGPPVGGGGTTTRGFADWDKANPAR